MPLENSDFDDDDSEWENEEEIMWRDIEFDKKPETFIKVLCIKSCFFIRNQSIC